MNSHTFKVPVLSVVLFGIITLTAYQLNDEIVIIWQHYSRMLGLVAWVLVPMAGLVVTSVLLLICGYDLQEGIGSVRDLQFVETGGPMCGLLGTCLALQNSFSTMNLSTSELDAAIASIIQTIGVALSTTAFGLILGVAAWAIRTRMVPVVQKDRPGQKQKKNASQVSGKTRPNKEVTRKYQYKNSLAMERPLPEMEETKG